MSDGKEGEGVTRRREKRGKRNNAYGVHVIDACAASLSSPLSFASLLLHASDLDLMISFAFAGNCSLAEAEEEGKSDVGDNGFPCLQSRVRICCQSWEQRACLPATLALVFTRLQARLA